MSFRTLLVAGVLVAAGSAHAAPISLFNTGVDPSGTPAPNGAPEIHYFLVSGSVAIIPLRTANASNGFPIGPWLGDDSLSAWIGPCCAGDLSGPAGPYI